MTDLKIIAEYEDNGEKRYICKESDSVPTTPSPTPVTTPVVTPVVTPTPVDTDVQIQKFHYDSEDKQFVISVHQEGKTPTEFSFDGYKFYPYSVIRQDPNKSDIYWLKISGNSNKIEVKTSDIHSTPIIVNFPDTVTPSTPIVTPTVVTPTPIIVPTPTPTNSEDGSGSEGNFDPTGSELEMFQIGETYEVPLGRNLIQLSSFSFGKTFEGKDVINGLDCYVKQFGKIVSNLTCEDGGNGGTANGGYPSNNHPEMLRTVIKEGEIEIGYRNRTSNEYHIVTGIAPIKNNEGYVFYRPNGLVDSNPIFSKELSMNAHYISKFNVEIKDDYGWVEEYQSGTLHKDLFINYYKDGKPYLEEMLWAGNMNTPIKANDTSTRRMVSKKDSSLWVEVQIRTGGYGQTGTIKLVASNGLTISKDTVRISGYVFNYGWKDENGNTQYNRREGIKNIDYKYFCNGGYKDFSGTSIIQKYDIA